jgi:single-strand DNA-binding protein
MNKYIAIGNLTQDPNCRDVGEAKVCSFGIAINEFYYKNNEKQKTTLFLDVEAWNRQAENCTKFLSKGKKVAIEGKLKTNSWEKNGQKFTKIFCLADKVHFLASEDSSNSNSAKSSRPTKEDMSNQEKVENTDNEVDDIDDIPF